MISKPVSPWPAAGPRLVAALAGLLSVSLPGLPALAQPPEPEAKAVISRLIGVIKDKRADREQRINACVALSQEDYRKQSADAIAPMVSFFEELVQEVPSAWSSYHPIVGPGLEKVALALGQVVSAVDNNDKAKLAVPVLVTVLKRPWIMQSYKRSAAAEALGKIGSKDAAPALIEVARQDRSAAVRVAVVKALQEIAAKNKDQDLAAELKAIALVDPKVWEAAAAPPEKKEADKKGEDKKPEDKKPEDKKPEDKGNDKKKDGDKKPDEVSRPEKLPSPRAGR
jgi:hypothetical protein